MRLGPEGCRCDSTAECCWVLGCRRDSFGCGIGWWSLLDGGCLGGESLEEAQNAFHLSDVLQGDIWQCALGVRRVLVYGRIHCGSDGGGGKGLVVGGHAVAMSSRGLESTQLIRKTRLARNKTEFSRSARLETNTHKGQDEKGKSKKNRRSDKKQCSGGKGTTHHPCSRPVVVAA